MRGGGLEMQWTVDWGGDIPDGSGFSVRAPACPLLMRLQWGGAGRPQDDPGLGGQC